MNRTSARSAVSTTSSPPSLETARHDMTNRYQPRLQAIPATKWDTCGECCEDIEPGDPISYYREDSSWYHAWCAKQILEQEAVDADDE